jgi:hypothetical protein
MTGMATKSIIIPIQNGSQRFVVIVRAEIDGLVSAITYETELI